MDMAQFRADDILVKKADENWPTASRGFPEVITAQPARNRDDSRVSPTDYALAEYTGNS
jgi:hypothetical protein